MNTCKNRLEIAFSSIGENVSLSRMLIAATAATLDFTINDLEELKVAVSEAVSNAIIHGYDNQPDQMVEMSALLYEDRLEIQVKDYGVGIPDIEKAMEPGYSRSPERMGLGFAFMSSFMDKLEVVSVPGEGTTVSMTKYLPESEDEG